MLAPRDLLSFIEACRLTILLAVGLVLISQSPQLLLILI